MTLLDVITPVPKTLIKDDERRKGVNRGILIAAVLMLAFLFIFWLFGDLSGISDASAQPVLLVLLELAKVLGGASFIWRRAGGLRHAYISYQHLQRKLNRRSRSKSKNKQPHRTTTILSLYSPHEEPSHRKREPAEDA